MKRSDLKNMDGLIWDMDGVLVDVSKSYREVIRKTAETIFKKPVTMQQVNNIKQIVGMNNDWDATYALIYGIQNPEKIDRDSSAYKKIYSLFQNLYLGTTERARLIDRETLFIDKPTLTKLKGKYRVMAIVTGRPRYEANYILEKFDIKQLFDIVIAMEDTKKGKPDSEPIVKVINQFKLTNTMYIGDSSSDVVAASNAHIPSLYIGSENLGDKQFPDITSLVTFLL